MEELSWSEIVGVAEVAELVALVVVEFAVVECESAMAVEEVAAALAVAADAEIEIGAVAVFVKGKKELQAESEPVDAEPEG